MNEEIADLLKVKQVAEMLTVSVRKVWRDVAAGVFPEPSKLGAKTTRWHESDVRAVIRGEWKSKTNWRNKNK